MWILTCLYFWIFAHLSLHQGCKLNQLGSSQKTQNHTNYFKQRRFHTGNWFHTCWKSERAKMRYWNNSVVVTAKSSREEVEWWEPRSSGEGPGRDGLDLSWGATRLVREYSNWHFDGQVASVDNTSWETRGCLCWEYTEAGHWGQPCALVGVMLIETENQSPFFLLSPLSLSLVPWVGRILLEASWQGNSWYQFCHSSLRITVQKREYWAWS